MSLRTLLNYSVLFTFFVFLLMGCSEGKQEKDVRKRITSALTSELAVAAEHFKQHKYSSLVTQNVIKDELVLILAEAAVTKTKEDGIYGGAAVHVSNGRVVVAVSAVKLTSQNWEKAFQENPSALFKRQAQHYFASLEKGGVTSAKALIILYLGIMEDGSLTSAMGICEVGGFKSCIEPRQFKAKQKKTGGPKLSLSDLSPKRCDVDLKGEIIQPGEGYLLTSEQIGASKKYFRTLTAPARKMIEQSLKSDPSPWFVSEKNIGMFDVDRAKARQFAIDHWSKELERANVRR